jgi:hypothetical protein
MEDGGIYDAIRSAAEAGKLRAYVRQHGGTGLAGLIRLADRHSAASKAALERSAQEAGAGGFQTRLADAEGLEFPGARAPCTRRVCGPDARRGW